MKQKRFVTYTWITVIYMILVIVWGALVRATGSGAGCGSHWPLCNGTPLPQSPQMETMIEYTHRITSGLAFIMVVIMLIWAYRLYPKKHPVRLGVNLSLLFMIIESLVGAGLVIFGWVAHDSSASRAFVVAIHLINTMTLLAVLTLTAWWASGGKPLKFKSKNWLDIALWVGFGGILLVGASGAVTALGDTLFPADSLIEGWEQKYSPTAHFLIRLRVYHPLIAIGIGGFIITIMKLFDAQHPEPLRALMMKLFAALYIVQLLVGAFNVALLAPLWLQLVHLFLSSLILVAQVIFMASALAQEEESSEETISPLPHSTGKQLSGV